MYLSQELSKTYPLTVQRILAYPGTPTTYDILTDRGRVQLSSIDGLESQVRFRRAMADVTRVVIPYFKSVPWAEIFQTMMNCVEDVPTGREGDELVLFRQLSLAKYLGDATTAGRDWDL